MTAGDSPISDFYPSEFEVDMNGKRNPWEAVNLLPFIDEKRLVAAVMEAAPDSTLTAEELYRNSRGNELIFERDPKNLETLPSSMTTVEGKKTFPDIKQVRSCVCAFVRGAQGRHGASTVISIGISISLSRDPLPLRVTHLPSTELTPNT